MQMTVDTEKVNVKNAVLCELLATPKPLISFRLMAKGFNSDELSAAS